MHMKQKKVWSLPKSRICSCTLLFHRPPNQRTMTMTAVPEAFPAVERASPVLVAIIKWQNSRLWTEKSAVFAWKSVKFLTMYLKKYKIWRLCIINIRKSNNLLSESWIAFWMDYDIIPMIEINFLGVEFWKK